jgi:hypothetical protein
MDERDLPKDPPPFLVDSVGDLNELWLCCCEFVRSSALRMSCEAWPSRAWGDVFGEEFVSKKLEDHRFGVVGREPEGGRGSGDRGSEVLERDRPESAGRVGAGEMSGEMGEKREDSEKTSSCPSRGAGSAGCEGSLGRTPFALLGRFMEA